jgi:hypothetical protein
MDDRGSIPGRSRDFSLRQRVQIGSGAHPVSCKMSTGKGAVSSEVKQPGREADHSPSFSAEVKNVWSYTSTPPYVSMAWCLLKHRDYFTLSL